MHVQAVTPGCLCHPTWPGYEATSYSGLLTQVFITCSTDRIQQVTNTEMRKYDEAHLPGYGLY